MSKKHECIGILCNAGVSYDDAWQLRKDSMALRRWFERECNGEVERDDESGKVYTVIHCYRGHVGNVKRLPARDMETPAVERVKAIVAKYPDYVPYIQTDPRGASVYLVRKADIPEGGAVDCYYSRGIAVYK